MTRATTRPAQPRDQHSHMPSATTCLAQRHDRPDDTTVGSAIYTIDALRAPLFVSWQLTRDCDLACLHCCTDSAPGKPLSNELTTQEAMTLAEDIVRNEVPYVMLCGGEPLVVPYFFAVAEFLGQAGVLLKIETNGQRFDAAVAERLARLPIRSIQISLDGDTQEVYGRQRPGASLAKAHAACRAVRQAGLPLEITFAPTRLNIHEAQAVMDRAAGFGAFRFNTGKLMRIGRAARLWQKIEPSAHAAEMFRTMLDQRTHLFDKSMQICHEPFTIEAGLKQSLDTPPATLLVLPNGLVKIVAALGFVCGDVRRMAMAETWDSYRAAWRNDSVISAIHRLIEDDVSHADANNWTAI
jgi:MoaA/NifB/PqqE/SkfB family radical SAM enzyme